jgi:uncharacterized membrane protein (DUF2068 family)
LIAVIGRGATFARVSHLVHKALKPIAIFEAIKGAVVFVLGFGLLGFLGREDESFLEQFFVRMHFDPANRYLHEIIRTLSAVSDTRLILMTGFATLYAAVRFAEAYGLWHARRWAEWFAALSGGIYIPVEIYELTQRVTWLRFAALLLNLIIVAYMVWLLGESRRARQQQEGVERQP